MQAGAAEHGMVHAVALEAAVAEDLPGLHAGDGVLDTGADLFVVSTSSPTKVGFLTVEAAVSDGTITADDARHAAPCRRTQHSTVPIDANAGGPPIADRREHRHGR
ncbi:MAG: hypothetical protein QOC85_2338 [Streptomyces sp.]|nr:hypothetical protein [Streptomyces sp.]